MIHNLKNIKGFTIFELIVVIAIIMTLSVAGFVSYNSFSQSIELEQSQETVINSYDESRLRILNGQATCSEIKINKTGKFFVIKENLAADCEKLSILQSVIWKENNKITLSFEEHINEIEIESYDPQGNKKYWTLRAEEEEKDIELSKGKETELLIYDPGNKDESLIKLYIKYFSPKNADQERVDHIIAKNIIGINSGNQEIEGETLLLKLTYPQAKAKIFVDGERMKRGEIVLEKSMTVLDPARVSLGDIIGNENVHTQTRLGFSEEGIEK